MNKFVKTLLITLAANIGAALLFCVPIFSARGEDGIGWLLIGAVVIGMGLLVQLIIGLVFIAGPTRKEAGKGMLLGVGILLLIGLAVCGGGIIGS